MLRIILDHSFELCAVILFGIGFMGMFFNRNLIKKIIGFNIMDASIYLFLTARGYIFGRSAPILEEGIKESASQFVNPIPAGLVLTGIVVSVSVTAFFLALVQRLYEKYHTLDLDKISRISHYNRLVIQAKRDREKADL